MSCEYHVGASEVSITPQVGCQMVHRKADSIHDDLYARALAFDYDGGRAALVGLDLISLTREHVARIKTRAKELCGIEAPAVLLCCSHTHAGPATNDFRGWGHGDPKYADEMIEKVAGCIADAFAKLAPAELSYGEWPMQIGFNRRLEYRGARMTMARNPDGPVDKRVRVLKVSDPATDKIRALLYSHGCHPVIIHMSTRSVSADYPGSAAKHLKEKLGKDVVPVFAQGCGADANVETLNGTFADLERIGSYVAWSVQEAMHRAKPIKGGLLCPMLKAVSMPTMIPTVEGARKTLEHNRAELQKLIDNNASEEHIEEFREASVEWAEDLLKIAQDPDTDHRLKMDVSALAFGDDLCIVGLQAEVFHRYHDICRSISPYPNTIVFSFVGGAVNYLPTAGEFDRGGYETASDYGPAGGYAYQRYGTLAFTPECENAAREAVQDMLSRK